MALPLAVRGPGSTSSVDGVARRTLDPRALENGQEIAAHLASSPDTCVMITGPSHTGKTQSAIAARQVIDPDGARSIHTSAQLLACNGTLVPEDRSALWQSWTAVRDLHKRGEAPKLVIIDEAGSRAPLDRPYTLEEAAAKRVLSDWRAQGTKFIVIGHTANENLTAWAEWLSGGSSHFAALDTRG